ncbi:MoaD/ThiS family protein [Nesterenkonia sp. Act20]|uniref:MoaD/ThiS family protein n=1 Tax=Nesterenkonia sp. Act20 TaxID=1483432 RepID=UPI002100649C|nr:MoaD/ThiS family protein [Nesterenkonia sp. Act20]
MTIQDPSAAQTAGTAGDPAGVTTGTVAGVATGAESTQGPASQQITVRFFAAAAEAAGAEQLQLPLPSPLPSEGLVLADLIADLPQLVRAQTSGRTATDDVATASDSAPSAAPSLDRVCARSSFLVNGVRARAESTVLKPGDQLDVLPPFAGG